MILEVAMGKVLSFINYKGGVGKTTTTYHIGCALALFHGKKCCLSTLTASESDLPLRLAGTVGGVQNRQRNDCRSF